MKFSDFCNGTEVLTEKVNMGDVLEGVFAIVVALQMAYGHVDPKQVDKVRRQMNVANGKEVTIDSNVADNPLMTNIQVDSEDVLTVKVKAKLKPNAVKGMFGPRLVPNPALKPYIEMLSEQVGNLSAIDKIQRFMIKILTNRTPDEVVFYVIADGAEGATSRGEIKGDVKLSIEAKTNTPIPQGLEQPLSFSLKFNDKTVSNLGMLSGIHRLGRTFNLPLVDGLEKIKNFPDRYNALQELVYEHSDKWDDESHMIHYILKYLRAQDQFLSVPASEYGEGDAERKQLQTEAEFGILRNLLSEMIDQFSSDVEGKDSDEFTADARDRYFAARIFQFLKKEMFGEDLADVIAISNNDIREIKSADFDNLKNEYVINFVQDGDKMKFYGININNERKLLFQIRPRFEVSPKGKKTQVLMVEVGDL